MHLSLHQSLRLLLCLSTWTAIARVPTEDRVRLMEKYYDDTNNAQQLEQRNASILLSRADDDIGDISDPGSTPCEPVCTYTGPIDWANSQAKRNLIEQGLALAKRVLDTWPQTEKEKNQYMVDRCNELTEGQSIIPNSSQDKDKTKGDSTAVSAKFSDYSTKPVRYGMQGIYGCTMMFVISRNAVYLGHYWEGQSFDIETNPDAENAFRKQVIGMLRRPFTTQTGAVQVALKDVAPDFADPVDPRNPTGPKPPIDLEHTFAVILTKDTSTDTKAPANKPKYPKKISSMASVAGDLLSMPTAPAILDRGTKFPPGKVYVATYVPAHKNDKALRETAAGHMLFDYDPKGLGSRSKPQKAWRLIWQNEAILMDQWT